MFENFSTEVRQVLPGIGGSILALFFIRRPALVLAAIFFGGCVLSVYAPAVAMHYLELDDKTRVQFSGFIGFVIGLFGMALVAKIYDLIEAINVVDLWRALVDGIRKRIGGGS